MNRFVENDPARYILVVPAMNTFCSGGVDPNCGHREALLNTHGLDKISVYVTTTEGFGKFAALGKIFKSHEK